MRHFRQTRAVTGARRWLLMKISLQPLQAIGDSCWNLATALAAAQAVDGKTDASVHGATDTVM
jgi:hypothetical protein